MVTTVVTEFTDAQIYFHYWSPLLIKHGEAKFVMHRSNNKFHYEQDNLIWANSFEEAMSKVDGDHVVITDFNAVPTYKFMTLVPKMGSRNEIITPNWAGYMSDPPTEKPNTFAVPRQRYKGETAKEYIIKNDPKIRNISSMYYVR